LNNIRFPTDKPLLEEKARHHATSNMVLLSAKHFIPRKKREQKKKKHPCTVRIKTDAGGNVGKNRNRKIYLPTTEQAGEKHRWFKTAIFPLTSWPRTVKIGHGAQCQDDKFVLAVF